MAQSLVQNYMHIVFSTKHREPLITEAIEAELHAYISTVCKNMECHPIRIGGTNNHIHILCMLSKKIALVQLLQIVKSHSSGWIKTKGENFSNFYWQDGYGAFSVNPTEIDTVTNYIANQKEYHKDKNFQDEFRAFLRKYKVNYDERYVWD